MSNLRLASMQSYTEADEFLGQRTSKKVGHNTWARRLRVPTETDTPEFDIAVRYHETDIVTYHHDGTITVHDGGWATATTVNRINMLTPAHFRVNHRSKRSTGDAWIIVTDLARNWTGTLAGPHTISPA